MYTEQDRNVVLGVRFAIFLLAQPRYIKIKLVLLAKHAAHTARFRR